jgi:hypothetical protein
LDRIGWNANDEPEYDIVDVHAVAVSMARARHRFFGARHAERMSGRLLRNNA